MLLVYAHSATSSIVQNAGTKVSLLEGSDLSKVANWQLPPGKWSNRISSITSESQRFLSGTRVAPLPCRWAQLTLRVQILEDGSSSTCQGLGHAKK